MSTGPLVSKFSAAGSEANSDGKDETRQSPHRSIKIDTYDIHDIFDFESNCPSDLNVYRLQTLISNQADLHHQSCQSDPHRLADILLENPNTIRGFILYAKESNDVPIGPVAYSIYYPMIDVEGRRVAYCEDFYISQSYRGYGVANILFHELAKRTMADNASYLLWATDKRNLPVLKFAAEKLGASQPNIVTINTTDLLSGHKKTGKFEQHGVESDGYVTRMIRPSDVNLVTKLGINPNIIRHAGDLTFKGFISFKIGNYLDPVAITPGWKHFSTFQLREGVHLENPAFGNITQQERESVMFSIIKAADTFAGDEYPYMRWHVKKDDTFVLGMLHQDLELPVDSMLGTPESELIVHTLANGALHNLAESNPSRTVFIPRNDPIGQSNDNRRPQTP